MKMIALLLYAVLLMDCKGITQPASRYAVIIDEIMADPSPQVGLPNSEWIELKNISSTAINLQGWRLEDATGQSGPMPSFLLQPDSFVIICTASATIALSAFGRAISVSSFPSLDNDGDQLVLKSAQNNVIHAVAYLSTWYQNELKKDGGWSLEMIDTKNPCMAMENWKASTDSRGGTPGKKNAADGITQDLTAPKLLRAFTMDSITIIALFNEPLDSITAATISNYVFTNGTSIISATVVSPFFQKVILKINQPLQYRKIYQLTANNLSDCKGNKMNAANTVNVGLAEPASANDIVINEILFNPRSNAYDYVEFLNRGNKIIDASKLYLANRNSSNAVSSVKQITPSSYNVYPGEYFVATEDLPSLQLNYLVKNPEAIFTLSSLPSFPDDKGYVLLVNGQGGIVDEVDYHKDWHFKLLDNDEGVALERVDPDAASNNAGNWHSAASTAGFGTPGYQNSQFKKTNEINAGITVTPTIFSPDNDGRDDIAIIQYEMAEPGYVINITIYDAAGRPARSLVKNATTGLKGSWNWDGLDDKNRPLPIGTYIIATEIFNLQSKKKFFKKTVVLARPFK